MPNDETLANALTIWSRGEQQPAVDAVRPLADEGEPAALLLIVWFLHQMGEPFVREGIPYAKRAAEQGNPWILNFYFGFLADDPSLRSEAISLIAMSPTGGVNSNDPIGRATNYAAEGDAKSAADMLRAAAGPHPWPQPPSEDEIRQRLTQIDQAVSTVNERQAPVLASIQRASDEVESETEEFRTRGKTLTQLLNSLSSAKTQTHFEEQAKKYGQESFWIWLFGVVILLVAACAAFTPVILNYVDSSRKLSGQSNVAAHLGAAVALAAVAGVLLARARSRDRERQRHKDLSVALLTMFTYSDQIVNEEARERFKHDMARLVLETFLGQEPSEDASRNLLTDITGGVGGIRAEANPTTP